MWKGYSFARQALLERDVSAPGERRALILEPASDLQMLHLKSEQIYRVGFRLTYDLMSRNRKRQQLTQIFN